jgi:F-type H+-transporting ATPase subunit g
MYTRVINPDYWTKMVNNGEWKKFAVYAVEAYGIFTIGEMVRNKDLKQEVIILTMDLFQIGRRHIVGYKIDKSAHPSHGGDHH